MSTDRTLEVSEAIGGSDHRPLGPTRITIRDGVIRSISACAAPCEGKRLMAMPALVDAHNHGRALSTTSFGAGMKPLETWLPRLAVIPPVDPYRAAAAAFARSARGGVTSVMVHLTKPMGRTDLADEVREIARAAADVGVNIGLAVAMRDRHPLVYADHGEAAATLSTKARQVVDAIWGGSMPSIAAQLAQVDAVADAVADLPNRVDVQLGPTGVQWCSTELLTAIADASAHSDRRVHMHLLETRPQRAWADAALPDGIVAHLNDIGLLTPRLTLAHCVWARPDELSLIARQGARIALNASSNLHLRSGMAPVIAMLAAGVEIAMGLDGCAFDEDDDALRELRLLHLLNAGTAFNPGLTIEQALHVACSAGRSSLGLPAGGILAEGMPADLLLLDLDALDRDRLMPVDPRHYLFTRSRQEHLIEVIANGRTIVRNTQPTGVDLPAMEARLRDEYRTALPDSAQLVEVWEEIEAMIKEHYSHYAGCC